MQSHPEYSVSLT